MNTRETPHRWWPEDRSWFVCTDHDLTFTLVGGSEALVAALMADTELECLRVTAATRVDADEPPPAPPH